MFRKIGLLSGLLLAVLGFSRCNKQSAPLEQGIWRATLLRTDGQQIPFNFEVKDSAGHTIIYLLNAGNRLKVDSIRQKGDSVFIQLPFFASSFSAKILQGKELSGAWTKDYGTYQKQMPFTAFRGDSIRIKANTAAQENITGSWDANFTNGKEGFKAIGLFQQQGQKVSGTFLVPSGDFRYLQGVVSGDTLKLSGFDGGYAVLFTAIIDTANKKLINGKLYSSNSPARNWQASKRTADSLPAAYKVENITPGKYKLQFTLKDMRTLKDCSLADSTFSGKVVILQLLGSWCPNCMDETPFLSQFYKENHTKGVAIIGIDFERTTNFEASQKALSSFFRRFDIPYPVVFSGVAANDSLLTEKAFPGLPEKIHAFPTLIFIDKSGYVRKIHSGINGPATGIYFEEFKKEFKAIVNGLLAE